MGKKTKIGKQRKDKYYQLAKETGFRSRAAFKLIQLNRKFEFLQQSQVCLDLCAAPGGWMQVAKQNMPISSVVVGVDLFPIKSIPGCISITEDITTEKCRSTLTKHLPRKADVILHDGAPNVGKNWLHDSYQQACLTLSSLRLATQFLKEGGWFVTKVFRSKDYQPLVWVLKQLFRKVHVTKPQASRNESAEIFVVCQHYIAPHKIDQKFLDPKYVFQELDIEPQNKLNVYHPEKKRKDKAGGYPENDYTLYHKLSAGDFVRHPTGIELLESASEIVLDEPGVVGHKKTTGEIRECCRDIKVLGRKDLKLLLGWRKALHDELAGEDDKNNTVVPPKPVDTQTQKAATDDEDEELKQVDQQILDLENEDAKDARRKKKKAQKERTKLNDRLNLKMVLKGDSGPTMIADGMFDLREVNKHSHMTRVMDQGPDTLAESDSDEDEDKRREFVRYQKDEQHLSSSGLYYKDSDSELELEEDEEGDDDGDAKEGLGLSDDEEVKTKRRSGGDDEEEEDKKKAHPLITDLDHRSKEEKKAHKAELWFERDIFKNLIDENDEDADMDHLVKEFKKKGAQIIGEDHDEVKEKKAPEAPETDSDYSSDSDSDYDVESQNPVPVNNAKRDGFEIVKNPVPVLSKSALKRGKKHKLSVEELALGTLMANSKKTKRDIIDAAWNRYTFNDDNLPDWFVEDEERHMKKELPVPKDLVEDYKKQLQDINVRPIKKVIEAKARKKKRAMKKLDKAKKKIEHLMDNIDVTDREKAKQVKQLYKKARQEPKKEVTYVVSKKHTATKRARRPAGVKGHYKVVDPRMKKDIKAQKAKLKTQGRGKKGNKNKTGRGGGGKKK